MTKYRIEVTEVLSRIVETDAENEDEAVEMVRQRYRYCEFVLDASDYIETEISDKTPRLSPIFYAELIC